VTAAALVTAIALPVAAAATARKVAAVALVRAVDRAGGPAAIHDVREPINASRRGPEAEAAGARIVAGAGDRNTLIPAVVVIEKWRRLGPSRNRLPPRFVLRLP
jgi:hypothetical protein